MEQNAFECAMNCYIECVYSGGDLKLEHIKDITIRQIQYQQACNGTRIYDYDELGEAVDYLIEFY